MSILLNESVWASAIRVAAPLLLAALGCLMCAKAGITNLAINGFMTVGCFLSIFAVDRFNGNILIGMLFAILGTMLYSMIYGLAVINLKANHIIASVAVNLLSAGLTQFLMAPLFQTQGLYRPSNIQKLPNISIPGLDKVPLLRSILNDQSFVVWVTIALIFVCMFVLNRTKYGLNVTAVGESPDAAISAGLHIDRLQWSVVLISGAICGLAGAYLSTVILSEFSVGMVSGRGFTAYSAMVFGAYRPGLIALATLLFGFADAIGTQIQLMDIGIPASIVSMIPYMLAIIALVISSIAGKIRSARR